MANHKLKLITFLENNEGELFSNPKPEAIIEGYVNALNANNKDNLVNMGLEWLARKCFERQWGKII